MDEKISDDVYRQIKAYALSHMSKIKSDNHNDKHVVRVKNNALKIVKILNLENQVNDNLLKAICLLHDFTYTIRKSNLYTYIFEGRIEAKIMHLLLDKFDLSNGTKKIIIDAVSSHAHSFPFRRLNRGGNVYTKVLQDADTLDFFDCLRIKMYIKEHDKGLFRKLKRKISAKVVEYGVYNLGTFLNYPILAKTFFLASSIKCV